MENGNVSTAEQIERLSMRYGSRLAQRRSGHYWLTGREMLAILDRLQRKLGG